ncbi:MAG: ATP-binding cassette domain-containing protein [Acidobacteria bacterium]|nr:ATP-binding cassette domain-containing protein [Acidobacteriota bacterium]
MISIRIEKDFGEAEREKFKLSINVEAPPQITILFGPSGSGKTTTIKSIAGIIRPDAGHISINGHTLFDSELKINRPIRSRKVGLVFQNLALFPHMTALANVEFATNAQAKHERRERALELMERLRIAHTASRRPHEISGGEAQRVALARALASKPRLLLLDEPLSAIDEAVKQDIIADLKMINRELHLPIIYVTHNRDEAVMLGHYLIAYEKGRITATGEPAEIFSGPVTASVARLTGVENVFDGEVLHRNSEAGTMTVLVKDESGESELEIPLAKESPGGRVRVAIRSGDILLATEELRSTSARNILSGEIRRIEERSNLVLVRVNSGVTWAVSVTAQAVRELGLAPGEKIWLAIKTHSCHLLEAD